MPTYQPVGSLDAWLDHSIDTEVNRGSSAPCGHTKRGSRARLGGSSRTKPPIVATSDAQAVTVLERIDSLDAVVPAQHASKPLLTPLQRIDVVQLTCTPTVLPGGLGVPTGKRQSLLSLQLRATSPVESFQSSDSNDEAEAPNSGSSDNPEESRRPTASESIRGHACFTPSVVQKTCEVGFIAARPSASPSIASAPAASNTTAPFKGTEVSAEPVTLRPSSSLLAAYFDSAESDAAMFAGSSASSSGGYHSSDSNALHYREESTGEVASEAAAESGAGAAVDAESIKAVTRSMARSSSSSTLHDSQQGPQYHPPLGSALSSPPRTTHGLARYASLDSAPGAAGARGAPSSFHRLAAVSTAADDVAAALSALPCTSEVEPVNEPSIKPPIPPRPTTSQPNSNSSRWEAPSCAAGEAGPGRLMGTKAVSYADLFSVQLLLPPDEAADRLAFGRASLDSRVCQAAAALEAESSRAGGRRHPRVHGGHFYLQHSLSQGGMPGVGILDSHSDGAVHSGSGRADAADLSSGEVSPALFEGTVRRGCPRKAAALARAVSQPITSATWESLCESAAAGSAGN